MKLDILDFFRLTLRAKHLSTGITVAFPQVHFLIEKSGPRYVATCLEYYQASDDESPAKAVTNLIQVMYQYFFSVIKKEGRSALYSAASSPKNNPLWDSIREYSARKNDLDLNFVEESFRNTDLDSLVNDLKAKNALSVTSGSGAQATKVSQESIIAHQQNLISEIHKIMSDQAAELARLSKENQQLRFGLEGADQWQEVEDVDIAPSSLFTQS